MAFDPDEFLSAKKDFDPDEFLAEESFDPDKFLAEDIDQQALDFAEKYGQGSPNRDISEFESGVLGSQEGLTLGFADEIVGVGKSALALAGVGDEKRSIFDTDEDSGYLDTLKAEYQAQRDDYRGYQGEAQKQNPKSYLGGQVGGGVLSTAVTGGMGPASLIAKGAIEGGAYGLGSSEADLTEGEFGEAALDTAKGATIGAVIPAGAKALKAGTKVIPKAKELVSKGLSESSKGLGKLVTGIEGVGGENVKKGMAKLLGISPKKLNNETIQVLKDAGLDGFTQKQTILDNISDMIIGLGPASPKNLSAKNNLEKVYKVVSGSDIGFINEAVSTVKNASVWDLAAMGGGPLSYAGKKSRDLLATRAQVAAPKLIDKASKASKATGSFLDKWSTKVAPTKTYSALTDSAEKLSELYSKPAFRSPAIQVSKEAIDAGEGEENAATYLLRDALKGTKYENLFGEDNHKNAVKHNVLFNQDPEYRKLMLNNEEE